LCLSFRKSLQTKHMMNCSLSALWTTLESQRSWQTHLCSWGTVQLRGF
jgi:hypothetical protein